MVIVGIEDPVVIKQILNHLAARTGSPQPVLHPALAPPVDSELD